MSSARNFFIAFALMLTMVSIPACVSMKGIFTHSSKLDPAKLEQSKVVTQTELSTVWPNETWWKAYQDPQLDALIGKAIADSPTLQVAMDRVSLSGAYVDNTKAQKMPMVGADASLVRERFTTLQFIPPPDAGSTEWNNKITANLTYDLDLWGQKSSIWKGAIDESYASAADFQQVRLELVTALVQNYAQLSMAFALRDVEEERLHLLKERISIARRELSAGLSTEMAVSEIEVLLPLAEARIERVDEHIALLRNQLAALSGQGSGAGDRILRPTISLSAQIGIAENLPANLIGKRPDLVANRWHIEAAAQGIESAKADFYPNINLISFVGFQALGFGQLLSNAGAIAGVGPAISLPIFDGGRRRSNLSANVSKYDMAVDRYNEILVHALQEVTDQLVILQSNSKQKKQLEQSLASAQKSYALAKISYGAGLENYQHQLLLQEVVINDKEKLVQLEAQRMQAHAVLMKALGGGVTSVEPGKVSQ